MHPALQGRKLRLAPLQGVSSRTTQAVWSTLQNSLVDSHLLDSRFSWFWAIPLVLTGGNNPDLSSLPRPCPAEPWRSQHSAHLLSHPAAVGLPWSPGMALPTCPGPLAKQRPLSCWLAVCLALCWVLYMWPCRNEHTGHVQAGRSLYSSEGALLTLA